jgi:DNA-binding NtrC family response regulator
MPVLVESLLARSRNSSPEFAKKLRAKKFIETLQNAAWPGNVRELRNHLEACLVLQELMRPDEPPPPEGQAQNSPASDAKLPYDQARAIALTAWERRYLRDLLDAHDWSVVAAAKAAGMSRAYLYRRMQFLGLRRKT